MYKFIRLFKHVVFSERKILRSDLKLIYLHINLPLLTFVDSYASRSKEHTVCVVMPGNIRNSPTF